MSDKVKVRIDGEVLAADPGQTILEVARANNKYIPALCYMEGLSTVGACRLCMVEVSGVARLVPACTTPVSEGQAVVTTSPQIEGYRKIALELLFAERNHVCSVCVANRHCELQDLAVDLGLDHIRLRYRFPKLTADTSHERFGVDHNRCVLCTRCVRVCDEVEGAHTWDLRGRGTHARLISDLGDPWGQSESCTSCGKCVQVCPTGTLFEKGKLATDIAKNPRFLTYIRTAREQKLWIK